MSINVINPRDQAYLVIKSSAKKELILTNDNYQEFLSLSQLISDLWADFWDAQYKRIQN